MYSNVCLSVQHVSLRFLPHVSCAHAHGLKIVYDDLGTTILHAPPVLSTVLMYLCFVLPHQIN